MPTNSATHEARPSRREFLRPRIVDMLAQRFSLRVLIVQAGAGFGKSVAVRQAIAENKILRRDRDLWLPIRDVGARVDGVLGRIGVGLGLRSEPHVDQIVEGVLSVAPEQVCFCVDDLHLLPDLSLIGALIQSLPSNGHLCLSTRVDPELPLARLMAAGDVGWIRENDLAYTTNELDEFAVLTQTPVQLLRASAGWPAHAALVAQGGAAMAERFVLEEVLSGFSEKAIDDIAAWSTLGRADAALLRAIFHEADPDLLAQALPLVDDDDDGLKLHDLWREPLKGHLDDLQIRATQAHAAREIVDRNPGRALELWTDARAWPELMAFFRDWTLGLRDPPGIRQVGATLEQLPPDIRSEPAFQMAEAFAALESDPARAALLYQLAASEFRSQGDETGEVAALLNLGDMMQAQRRESELRSIADRVSELAGRGEQWIDDVSDVLSVMQHRTARNSQAGIDLLTEIEQRGCSLAIEPMLPWLEASLCLQLGRPRQAIEAATRALDSNSATIRALAIASLGWALWLEGDSDATLSLMEESMEIVQARADPSWIQTAATYFAYALLMVGRTGDGEDLIQAAHAVESAAVGNAPTLAVVDALHAVLIGDEAAAAMILGDTDDSDLVAGDMMRRTCVLWYVLRPTLRERLHRLEGCYATVLTVAVAFVQAREGDIDGLGALDLPAPKTIGAHLPPPWSAELALGLTSAGRTADAVNLVEALPAAVRAAVVDRNQASPSEGGRVLLQALPPKPRCVWRVLALGRPELIKDGEPTDDPHWRRGRVRELLLWLIENPGGTRSTAMTAIWPDLPERRAKRNLEVTLSYLLALLDGDRQPDEQPYYLRQNQQQLTLHRSDAFTCDVDDFERALAQAAECESRSAPTAALAHYSNALRLYRGTYLGLRSEPEWAERPKARVAAAFVATAARAAELLIASGEPGAGAAVAERGIAADPWHERSRRALVRAHFENRNLGRTAAAVAEYNEMAAEIGCDPHAEVSDIHTRITAADLQS